jgi:thiosulfate dehydrogenase
MRLLKRVWLPVLLILIGFALMLATGAQAQGGATQAEIIRGAVLYDKWYAALGVAAPPGDMPIWGRQTTNTRSGADTWRCVECHGWDYRGSQGAYGSGSHYTGFPDILTLVANLSEADIVNHLKGANDPDHDFSKYLDGQSMTALAKFLKYGIIDDSLYIDSVSMRVIGGDVPHGEMLFQTTCSGCHGEDGAKIIFRGEGIDEALGDVAKRDPWRFLHRTRFGNAGTSMPIGAELGWSPANGRDVLAYVQTLPTEQTAPVQAPAVEQAKPAQQIGGPGNNWWNGLLTSLGAFFAAMGYAIVFIGGFLLMGFLVVILLRRRK